MEQTQKPSTRTNPREDEVDLGQLFYKTGGAISSFFNWLGRMFMAIGNLIIKFLFFLRRNFLWLGIGTLVGMGYGFYLVKRDGNNYFSVMTVQANYNSSRTLYSTIDYLNALIGGRQHKQLSTIFNINEQQASSLKSFYASPVESETIVADLYKNRFLNLYHNTRVRMDTFWIKTINYKDFKEALTKYDYPLHEVRATSNDPAIFSRLQQGVISLVSSNKLLQEEMKNVIESNQMEVNLLESSIKSLDTLRDSYNKRLSRVADTREGTNVTLLDGNVAAANPELQLYDKMLLLKDELKMVRSQTVAENQILQVYSPFNPVGKSEGLLQHKIIKFAYIGLLVSLVILALVALNKYLAGLETRMKKEQVSPSEP